MTKVNKFDKVKISHKCEQQLHSFWTKKEIREGMKDPVKFIRKVVNLYLRDLRRKGKPYPIIQIKGREDNIYLVLSDELS